MSEPRPWTPAERFRYERLHEAAGALAPAVEATSAYYIQPVRRRHDELRVVLDGGCCKPLSKQHEQIMNVLESMAGMEYEMIADAILALPDPIHVAAREVRFSDEYVGMLFRTALNPPKGSA